MARSTVRRVQTLRRIGSAGLPTTAEVLVGELIYQRTAAAGAGLGPDDLHISDGAAIHPLVSASRQVELAGTQTITGNKTFENLTIDVTDLSLEGGTNGAVLTTDGAGGLSWVTAPPATVVSSAPLTGNGTAGTPVTAQLATAGDLTTGTSTTTLINPAVLATLTGSPTALATTSNTIIGAVNELRTQVLALESAIQFVGTVNGTSGAMVAAAGSPATSGPLPAAAAGNTGWMVIATAAGPGGNANLPAGPIAVGDLMISNGSAWVLIPLNLGTMAAANVSVTAIDSVGWTNVQQALQALYTAAVDDGPFLPLDGGTLTTMNGTGDGVGLTITNTRSNARAINILNTGAGNSGYGMYVANTGGYAAVGIESNNVAGAGIEIFGDGAGIEITYTGTAANRAGVKIDVAGGSIANVGEYITVLGSALALDINNIAAGATSLRVRNAAANHLLMTNNGVLTLGTPTGGTPPTTPGNVNISGGYYVNGVALGAAGSMAVLTDGTSITGTGLTGAPLTVETIDAGTY